MKTYNFNEALGWNEFQRLACRIVQKRENIQLQTYRPGPDGGVDGLWFDEQKKLVVQAKNYKSNRELIRELRNKEVDKVKKLAPDRYILVVALPLSKEEQEQIYRMFEGYIRASSDLIDGNVLNELLAQREYHEIERDFTDLWLPHTEVWRELLEETIHRGVRNLHLTEYEKALNVGRVFVQTGTYEHALAMLNTNHTVIISGEPGMGKTTLAYILALEFLEETGFEGFIWVNRIDEILSQWDYEGKRQVFILDDFWGSTFYENKRKETRKLEELIYRVKGEADKRLIITSREYIVQQEICQSPGLKDILERLQLECVQRDYSDAEKAKILFAHLKNSELEYEYVMAIYRACDRIVYHPGYSPRVIGKFIRQSDSREFTPGDYVSALVGYLEYPENFWKEIFEELSEEARVLAMILAISYTPIGIADIRQTYGQYVQNYAGDLPCKSFETCISELEKTFVTTYWSEDEQRIVVTFENPSIIDFLYYYLGENQEYYVPRLCRAVTYYNQLLALLEHIMYRDDGVKQLVEKRCVEEFYLLPMKLRDYGSPDYGERDAWDGSDWARRGFHLMRISKPVFGGLTWNFIRSFVETFFDEMGQGQRITGVDELINFIGILRLCEKSGMHFDGRAMLEKYWKHAFLASHYVDFEDLGEIYPEAYGERSADYMNYMKKNLKAIILQSLEYLAEEDYFEQMDSLVDEIPVMLKKYGLRYTDKYKEKIRMIAGWCCEEVTYQNNLEESRETSLTREEEDYEAEKREGYRWLFGESEQECLEDEELIAIIKKARFPRKLETQLVRAMEKAEPWYIYDMLQTSANIELFRTAVEKAGLVGEVRNLEMFMASRIQGLCGKKQRGRADVVRVHSAKKG